MNHLQNKVIHRVWLSSFRAIPSFFQMTLFELTISLCVHAQWLTHVRLLVTTRTRACQASLSMGFPRQEYWSGLSFPSPGDLPGPGIELVSLTSSALSGVFFTTEPPGKHCYITSHLETAKRRSEFSHHTPTISYQVEDQHSIYVCA